jgi:DNA-directed RNA polymerase specialized sigma24 family protein
VIRGGPPRRSDGPSGDRLYSETAVAQISSRAITLCVAFGLTAADAQDVAQDVCLWLLRNGCPTLATTGPWLGAVVHNYVLRHRRRSGRRNAREGTRLDEVAEPGTDPDTAAFETNEILDRVAPLLPETERRLLALLRGGSTLAQAARALGIPRGSRDYYGKRLVTTLRRSLAGGAARSSSARAISSH